ncbi:MAG: sigma-70 family RNA polymerase sigma factor [candidate division WOR-3 bacterium]
MNERHRKSSDSSLEYLSQLIEEIKRNPLALTQEEEKDLLNRAKIGDREAIEKLVVQMLPQVYERAKYLAHLFQLGSDVIPDLVNEGNRGVLVAIKKYDFSKSARFSSYAWYWIREYMFKFLKNYMGEIKFPDAVLKKIRIIKKAEKEYIAKHGVNPNDEDIANLTGLSPHDVRALRSVVLTTKSIESEENEDESRDFFMDIVNQQALPSPDKYYAQIKASQLINEIFAFLSKKEADILRLNFGFEDGKKYTLEEIGNKLGITKQRVSQLRDRALKRLKEKFGDRILNVLAELTQESVY